jgi:hypothetical protein
MGVVVDDSRHQREAAGIDRFLARALDAPDLGDAPVHHREIAAPRRRAEPVDDERAADH